nr:hypothetical protein [Tanacetum cinerariifolium]
DNVTSRTSTLWLVEGKSKGFDDVGLVGSGRDDIGNGGDSIWGSGESIWGNGDDHGESGDGGGVGIVRSQETSVSEGSDMGVWARTYIL